MTQHWHILCNFFPKKIFFLNEFPKTFNDNLICLSFKRHHSFQRHINHLRKYVSASMPFVFHYRLSHFGFISFNSLNFDSSVFLNNHQNFSRKFIFDAKTVEITKNSINLWRKSLGKLTHKVTFAILL